MGISNPNPPGINCEMHMVGRNWALYDYSESKYSVESVSGKYLENGWSDQNGDFSDEFVLK